MAVLSPVIPKGGTLHSQTSTFGASLRGDLLVYQRRFGVGVGGQDSPGPAYALPKRSEMSFGGSLRSSNVMVQQQEERQRRQIALGEDPRMEIRSGLSTIKKRAQSASPLRSPSKIKIVSSSTNNSGRHQS